MQIKVMLPVMNHLHPNYHFLLCGVCQFLHQNSTFLLHFQNKVTGQYSLPALCHTFLCSSTVQYYQQKSIYHLDKV